MIAKHDPIAEAALASGEALLAAGHLPAAIAEFQRAAERDPGLEAARVALGSAWLDAGEPERAVAFLSTISANSPLREQAAAKIAQAKAMGQANRAAPGYVRHLFDQFAPD